MPSAAALALLSGRPGNTSVTTSSGKPTTLADLNAALEPAPSRADGVVETGRWPLPGAGLHALDRIQIAGVWLPLAEMPQGADELDVSERKQPGSDFATFVSHGRKSVPVRITLLLFRDETLGWKDGRLVGKDWHAEYGKIRKTLLAKNLDKRGAVPVYYPTLQARGCTSLIFTHVGDPVRARGLFFTVALEGRDPRTVRKGGGSKKVQQVKDFGSRANPIPPQQAKSAQPSTAKKGK